MQCFHMSDPNVTLKMQLRSLQVDIFEIISMVIIYPNLKAIGEMRYCGL